MSTATGLKSFVQLELGLGSITVIIVDNKQTILGKNARTPA
jgi:hypothetical protein